MEVNAFDGRDAAAGPAFWVLAFILACGLAQVASALALRGEWNRLRLAIEGIAGEGPDSADVGWMHVLMDRTVRSRFASLCVLLPFLLPAAIAKSRRAAAAAGPDGLLALAAAARGHPDPREGRNWRDPRRAEAVAAAGIVERWQNPLAGAWTWFWTWFWTAAAMAATPAGARKPYASFLPACLGGAVADCQAARAWCRGDAR